MYVALSERHKKKEKKRKLYSPPRVHVDEDYTKKELRIKLTWPRLQIHALTNPSNIKEMNNKKRNK